MHDFENKESELYNNILDRIDMLKSYCHDSFIIGNYCYMYDYSISKYIQYSYGKLINISREELINLLEVYLRRIKLEKIISKI
jgi:hypothetical protein